MPLAKAIAMINLDMIGRVRDNRVFVGGVGSSANFKALVEGLNQSDKEQFYIEDTDTGGYGSSDHYSFTPEQIPFLFFFSGLHPDYHTPSDTWDRVTAPQTAKLLGLVGRVVESLLDSPERPAFRSEPRP
jgi:Zn-dependent M28 family amino/carboxypeptidase